MKIMFFEAYPGYSGAQKIVLSIAEKLESKNYKIQYVLPDCINGNGYKIYKERINNVKCLKAPSLLLQYGDAQSWFKPSKFIRTFLFGLFPYIFKLTRYIYKEKIDLIFCADIRGLVMVFIPAILLKKKIIWHVHGRLSINKKINYFLSKRISKIIVPSRAVANTIEYRENLEVIYNGIEDPKTLIDKKSIKETKNKLDLYFNSLGFNKKRINILCIATFYPQKGLHHLLKALNNIFKIDKSFKLKYTLTIVGACKKKECREYENFLYEYVKKNNMEKNVFFAGWQTNVFPWIANSDLFVFPSIDNEVFEMKGNSFNIKSSEGLPTVLIESTMLGVWTIATNVTGVNEIINQNNGTIIEPSSSEAIKNAILKFKPKEDIVTDFNEKFKSYYMHNKFIKIIENI